MDNLNEYGLGKNPLENWENWYKLARTKEVNPEAFTLSTVDDEGNPHGRMLLYKGMSEGRFLIFTNLESPKAIQLENRRKAAMTFFWPRSERQVRISADVQVMEPEKAQKYFNSRERGSQIASTISRQSQPIEDRETLLKKFEALDKEFEGKEIPCPTERWGGFYLLPHTFEFFIYREFRLNDRFVFKKEQSAKWNILRIQP